jgi:sarcosine oxidase
LNDRVRIVIAGGGVVGLLSAVAFVSAGHEVVLAERGELPCPAGASFDAHRVVRALHRDDPRRTAQGVQAHHAWLNLQRTLDEPFYRRTGVLSVLDAAAAPAAGALLDAAGARSTGLDHETLRVRYPHVVFPTNAVGVLEADAGVLLADRVLAASVRWLRRHSGADLLSHRPVVEVDADRARVRLADGTELAGDAVLLAAGPWSRALLPPPVAAQLTLRRQSLLYCSVPDGELARWRTTPPMLGLGPRGGAWFVPPVAGTPLKLSSAGSCRPSETIADRRTAPHACAQLAAEFRGVIPTFRPDWVRAARDAYYLEHAATGGPLVVDLGDAVVAHAACGGASFKFAPLIAARLLDRLTRQALRGVS